MKKRLKSAVMLLLSLSVITGCMNIREHPGETEGRRNEVKETEKTEVEGVETSETGNAEKTVVQNEKPETDSVWTDPNMVQAVYPKMAPYPNEEEYFDKKTNEFDSNGFLKVFDEWREEKRSRRNLPEGYADNLTPFFVSSIRQFLTEEIQEEENRIYSPLNVYMALSMLAEVTDGNSRQQILALLNTDSLDNLRLQANQVWNANYSQDGAVTSLLANSLWIDETVKLKQETQSILADYYYASSYWGQMGSEALDRKLQAWLNEQTGGLLEEQAAGIHMTSDTLVALASTVYFRARWSDEFFKSNTVEEVFHGPQEKSTCDFMHQSGINTYYWGEKFGAINKSLQESGGMWLILPDEGVTLEEVLLDEQVMELFLSGKEYKNQKRLMVNLAMPKFDVVSNISLKEGLNKLGVADVFDGSKSDFTPLVEGMEGIFVSQASHAARVTVDEEGCVAAAYTVMAAAGGSMPLEEEMDFVLDRPFLFIITSDTGFPLFAGIVNQP